MLPPILVPRPSILQPALAATKAVHAAVKWGQTWLLERWGERDNSQARLGTRFEAAAEAHGQRSLVASLNNLTDLDDDAVARRMAAAPAWVGKRHERQWRARRHVGEAVTRAQDLRDVLRVCSL